MSINVFNVAYAENTAAPASVTLTPHSEGRIAINRIICSYSSSSQSGTLTVQEGANTLFVYDVHGSDSLTLEHACKRGQSVQISLSAGGVGVVGRLTVQYHVY